MKIIEANKFHSDIIIEMLKSYREVTPIDFFKDCNNEKYINTLLAHIFAGRGIALLAYDQDKPVGMLIAFIDQSIWDPELRIMKELAYWVYPESRGSTAGYRLLSKYNEMARVLLNTGQIKTWTISKMANSPDLNYSRLGFNKIEETWSMN